MYARHPRSSTASTHLGTRYTKHTPRRDTAGGWWAVFTASCHVCCVEPVARYRTCSDYGALASDVIDAMLLVQLRLCHMTQLTEPMCCVWFAALLGMCDGFFHCYCLKTTHSARFYFSIHTIRCVVSDVIAAMLLKQFEFDLWTITFHTSCKSSIASIGSKLRRCYFRCQG